MRTPDDWVKMAPAEIAGLDAETGHRILMLIYLMDDEQRRLFSCDCADRTHALMLKRRRHGKRVHRRNRTVVEVARQFALGNATKQEMKTALANADGPGITAVSLMATQDDASDAAYGGYVYSSCYTKDGGKTQIDLAVDYVAHWIDHEWKKEPTP